MSTSALTIGRWTMFVSNLVYAAGAFIADWNETHIYNPTWPGHARFHNGQTMTLGILLAAASAVFAFRKCDSAATQKDSLRTAAIIGSMYCVAGLSAILYPGTTWSDPPVDSRPQVYLFPSLLVLNWVGYSLGVSGINKPKRV